MIDIDDNNYKTIIKDLIKDANLARRLISSSIYGIVTNYIEGIDTFTLLELTDNYIDKQWGLILCSFIIQMLKIVDILHSKDIVHGDIKLQNIIATSDPLNYKCNGDNYYFVLIDVGVMRICQFDSNSN